MITYAVLTHNSDSMLENCLKSIKSQKLKKEVLVIDSESTDDTLQIAQKYKAKIFNEPEGNMAKARNIALDKSKGDYIAFVDSDVILPKDWDILMVRSFTNMHVVGVSALNISILTTWVTIELDRLSMFYMRKGVHESYSIPTMNAFYSKKRIGKIRFNPKMRRVAEDLEFNMQLREKGYKLILNAKRAVYHNNPDTLTKLFIKSFRYGLGYRQAFDLHPKQRKTRLFMLRMVWLFGFVMSIPILILGNASLMFLLLIAPFVTYARYSTKPRFLLVHGVKQLGTLLGMVVGVFKR